MSKTTTTIIIMFIGYLYRCCLMNFFRSSFSLIINNFDAEWSRNLSRITIFFFSFVIIYVDDNNNKLTNHHSLHLYPLQLSTMSIYVIHTFSLVDDNDKVIVCVKREIYTITSIFFCCFIEKNIVGSFLLTIYCCYFVSFLQWLLLFACSKTKWPLYRWYLICCYHQCW